MAVRHLGNGGLSGPGSVSGTFRIDGWVAVWQCMFVVCGYKSGHLIGCGKKKIFMRKF